MRKRYSNALPTKIDEVHPRPEDLRKDPLRASSLVLRPLLFQARGTFYLLLLGVMQIVKFPTSDNAFRVL